MHNLNKIDINLMAALIARMCKHTRNKNSNLHVSEAVFKEAVQFYFGATTHELEVAQVVSSLIEIEHFENAEEFGQTGYGGFVVDLFSEREVVQAFNLANTLEAESRNAGLERIREMLGGADHASE